VDPLKVAIIEDRREIRDGLATLIGGTPGYQCCGVFRSVEEALGAVERDPPDVALLDVGLPGMSGIEGIPLLKDRCPGTAVLMLTVYADDERIIQAVCAGACGYLLKGTPPARLLECLKEVAEGGAPMSPEVARRVVELFRLHPPPDRAEVALTPHEARLLKLLMAGHTYKTAADEVGVTAHTVSFHLRRIYEKLEVHSRTEAVAKALRQGLIH
jgi:DNA-binding NarL/FixJ family response regulator